MSDNQKTVDRDRIIDKIRKCLALSQSDNQHEAASAMRQAQKLMKKYSIDAATVDLPTIKESAVRSIATVKHPVTWEAGLAHTVSKAFGLHWLWVRGNSMNRQMGIFLLIGEDCQVEVGGYTMQVLQRQIGSARRGFISDLKSTYERMGRHLGNQIATSLANDFCMGWVAGVYDKIEDFANPERIENEMQKFIATEYGDDLAKTRVKGDAENVDLSAYRQGLKEAESVSIHRPIG